MSFLLITSILYIILITIGRSLELFPQLYSWICELQSISYSYSQITRVYFEIKFSTIKIIYRHEASRDNNINQPRYSMPRKFLEKQKDYFYDTIIYQNPYIKIRELLEKIDSAIKKHAI
jgi:hypothetical protein